MARKIFREIGALDSKEASRSFDRVKEAEHRDKLLEQFNLESEESVESDGEMSDGLSPPKAQGKDAKKNIMKSVLDEVKDLYKIKK